MVKTKKEVIEKMIEYFDEYAKTAEQAEFPRLYLFEIGLKRQLKMYDDPDYVMPDSEFQALLRVANKLIGYEEGGNI